jgi:protein TonB
MFSNLIESTSHRAEIKRRSTFLMFTTATYGLLLAIAGVASVYAYDAKLKEQDLDLTVLTFAPPVEIPITPPRVQPSHVAGASSNVSRPMRIELYESVNNPRHAPELVSVAAQPVPPAPANAVRGPLNVDPPAPAGDVVRSTGPSGNAQFVPDIEPPPPPKPTPAVPKILRSGTVLNSKALLLPKPLYTPMAKAAHAHGIVTVQVLIDETGKVISAKALSGHPLLVLESQKAAYQARFSPTMIGDQPVKVSGMITYNFIMN